MFQCMAVHSCFRAINAVVDVFRQWTLHLRIAPGSKRFEHRSVRRVAGWVAACPATVGLEVHSTRIRSCTYLWLVRYIV